MQAKAATGELLDRGEDPFDLAAMRLWGEERTVSAVVLRDLLVGTQWPVHAKGVRLRGVRISGLAGSGRGNASLPAVIGQLLP